jgi:hypothetical protein
MTQLTVPFVDFSEEKANATLYVTDAISDAQITALFDGIVGITLGNAQKAVLKLSVDKDVGTVGPPAATDAQREMTWQVRGYDTTYGKLVKFSIPCADHNQLSLATDKLNVGVGTNGEDFVTALEAVWRSHINQPETFANATFSGKAK